MDPRYISLEIQRIFGDANKLRLWRETELAVIRARAKRGVISQEVADKIEKILRATRIDEKRWKEIDADIHHDYNAYVMLELALLPPELQEYFHSGITTFDGEEAPFSIMLAEACAIVLDLTDKFSEILKNHALKYRYTPMMGATHGQFAEMMTFGKRNLSWYQDMQINIKILRWAIKWLTYSKISGAIGNYNNIDPEVERIALEELGKKPYYGATQIMPRETYAQVASALYQIVSSLNKIALTIRLGARTPYPIYQEPFKSKQMGSSVMPHKKNTIRTEQIEGMNRMALGYLNMIMLNIPTWEERAIEQSCVERVAWADLFHVAVHSLNVMVGVIGKLNVYPDNMLRQIFETRGCYASGQAKEFIRSKGSQFGLQGEEGYRIVQVAAFMAHGPNSIQQHMRNELPKSLSEVDQPESLRGLIMVAGSDPDRNIKYIIQHGLLKVVPELAINQAEVEKWNNVLEQVFSDPENCQQWEDIFKFSTHIKTERELYVKVFGV